MFRGTHGTYQNFIGRPGNADVDSTGCQGETLPQTFNQLVTSAHLGKPWRAQEVEGQCFRKHPESSPRGTGILCPEQLGEPTKFSHNASPAHVPSQSGHRTHPGV